MASCPPAGPLPPCKRLRFSLLEPPLSLHPLSLDDEHLLERSRKKIMSRASSSSSPAASSPSSSRSSSCVSVCSSSRCALHMHTDHPRDRVPADKIAQLAGETCRLPSQDNHASRLASNEFRNDSIAPELGCLSKERHGTSAEYAECFHRRGERALAPSSKHESFRSERRVASAAQELECSHTGSSIAMAEQDLECSATSGSCQEYMTSYDARLQDEEAESCSGEDVQLLDINCFFENWEESSTDMAGATGLSFDPASVFQSDAQGSSDCDDALLPSADDACMQLLAAQACGGNEDWFLNGMDTTDGSSVLNEVLDQHWMSEAMANFDVLNADACMLHFLDSCPGL